MNAIVHLEDDRSQIQPGVRVAGGAVLDEVTGDLCVFRLLGLRQPAQEDAALTPGLGHQTGRRIGNRDGNGPAGQRVSPVARLFRPADPVHRRNPVFPGGSGGKTLVGVCRVRHALVIRDQIAAVLILEVRPRTGSFVQVLDVVTNDDGGAFFTAVKVVRTSTTTSVRLHPIQLDSGVAGWGRRKIRGRIGFIRNCRGASPLIGRPTHDRAGKRKDPVVPRLTGRQIVFNLAIRICLIVNVRLRRDIGGGVYYPRPRNQHFPLVAFLITRAGIRIFDPV